MGTIAWRKAAQYVELTAENNHLRFKPRDIIAIP
jgi:hypothetical protein